MPFLQFMATGTGRIVRAVAGISLIALGVTGGGAMLALVVVGLVPLAAGILDFCILAPFAKQPMVGKDFRARTH